MKRALWAAAALFLWAPGSYGQDHPRADVAVGYSHLEVLPGYTIGMDGGSASVAVHVSNWLGIAGDLGVYHGYPGRSLTGETYTFGPRFTYRRLDRVMPFAQALFGGSHFSASSGGITGGGNEFAFALGGGADFALRHRAKLALRPQCEYLGIRSGGSTTNTVRFSTGLVFRI